MTFNAFGVLLDPGEALRLNFLQVGLDQPEDLADELLRVVAGQHLEHQLGPRRRTDLDVERGLAGIDLASGKQVWNRVKGSSGSSGSSGMRN